MNVAARPTRFVYICASASACRFVFIGTFGFTASGFFFHCVFFYFNSQENFESWSANCFYFVYYRTFRFAFVLPTIFRLYLFCSVLFCFCTFHYFIYLLILLSFHLAHIAFRVFFSNSLGDSVLYSCVCVVFVVYTFFYIPGNLISSVMMIQLLNFPNKSAE